MEQYIKNLASQWLTEEEDRNALEFIKALDYYSLSYYFDEFIDNPKDKDAFDVGLLSCIALNKDEIFTNEDEFYITEYLHNLSYFLIFSNQTI